MLDSGRFSGKIRNESLALYAGKKKKGRGKTGRSGKADSIETFVRLLFPVINQNGSAEVFFQQIHCRINFLSVFQGVRIFCQYNRDKFYFCNIAPSIVQSHKEGFSAESFGNIHGAGIVFPLFCELEGFCRKTFPVGTVIDRHGKAPFAFCFERKKIFCDLISCIA